MSQPAAKRERLQELLRAEAALKKLLDGTDDDERKRVEMVLTIVKAEIEIVKAELSSKRSN